MTESRESFAAEAPRYLPLGLLAAVVVALDQWSKMFVTSYLQTQANHKGTSLSQAQVNLLGGKVTIDYVTNTGAAFGVLPNQTILFSIIAAAIIVAIVLSYHRLAQGPLALRLGLGLVLGGAVGNLLDRARLGYVVDFIDLRWWPVFNVADGCIVTGVAILVVTLMFQPDRPSPQA